MALMALARQEVRWAGPAVKVANPREHRDAAEANEAMASSFRSFQIKRRELQSENSTDDINSQGASAEFTSPSGRRTPDSGMQPMWVPETLLRVCL